MRTRNRNAEFCVACAVCLMAAVAILFSPAAYSRDFPQDAMRGAVKAFGYPKIQIGDVAYHMTPASKIFNEQNLIILPIAMPATTEIMYHLDFSGHIRSIWLLTPEEIRALGPAPSKPPKPATPQ